MPAQFFTCVWALHWSLLSFCGLICFNRENQVFWTHFSKAYFTNTLKTGTNLIKVSVSIQRSQRWQTCFFQYPPDLWGAQQSHVFGISVSEVMQTLQLSAEGDQSDVVGDLSVCLDGMEVDPEMFASAEVNFCSEWSSKWTNIWEYPGCALFRNELRLALKFQFRLWILNWIWTDCSA